jgi:hypothetical protein
MAGRTPYPPEMRERAEAAAGPTGWREWLLGMRNSYRIVTVTGRAESRRSISFLNRRRPSR